MIFFDNEFPAKPKEYRNQTLSWCGSDTYKRFRKYKPNPYTENDITYKLNEYGFRSDRFDYSDHRMVFLGCSFTEGIGLPLEETFSYLIYTQIKKMIGKEFPYWNLGLGGCGLDSIIRCYYYFYKKLKPQVAIAFFPSYRLEFFTHAWHSALLKHDPYKIFSKNPFLLDKHVIEYSTEKNLAMLDLMLEQNKTLLVWDRWDDNPFENVNFSQLSNFENYAEAWWLAVERSNPSSFARDGMHPGKKTNEEFAKIILDKYGDIICNRLVNDRGI